MSAPERRHLVTGELVADGRPTSVRKLTRAELKAAAYHIVDRRRLFAGYLAQPDRASRGAFTAAIARQLRHEQEQEAARRRPPLDITAARARLGIPAMTGHEETPPARPPDALAFVTDGEWRWVYVTSALPEWRAWERLMAGLAALGGFSSIQVRHGALDAPHGGMTSVRTGHGRTWIEVTVDPRQSRDEQTRIMRHETAHVADIAACGANWPRLNAPRRRAVAEAFAERMETELDTSMTASALVTQARLHMLMEARRVRR